MESPYNTVVATFDDDTGIAKLTLDRPDSLNALSRQLRDDLASAIDDLKTIDDAETGATVRAIVVDGAGDQAFCAGADVNEFTDAVDSFFYICPARDAFENCSIPIVAEIDGYCLGGGFELALAADIRLASDRATFGFPEVNHGILPAGGGIQYLTRTIGPARTKQLLLEGKQFSPDRAKRLGLINNVYAADQLEDRVIEIAETIASKPPLATRAIKDSVNRITASAVQDGREYDRGLSFMLKSTQDHEKAIEAFNGDHTPTFEGR